LAYDATTTFCKSNYCQPSLPKVPMSRFYHTCSVAIISLLKLAFHCPYGQFEQEEES
jgi:hypothetical protein